MNLSKQIQILKKNNYEKEKKEFLNEIIHENVYDNISMTMRGFAEENTHYIYFHDFVSQISLNIYKMKRLSNIRYRIFTEYIYNLLMKEGFIIENDRINLNKSANIFQRIYRYLTIPWSCY